MKYGNVVFLEFNDPEGISFDEFYAYSDDEKFDYLHQWYYPGEIYYNVYDDEPFGKSDTVVEYDDFILSYNWDLEYASLVKKINERDGV